MSEEKKKKLSEEAEKFFDFLDVPAVQGKIQEYIKDAEQYEPFKEAVDNGEIAFIFAFGQSGWSCFGSEDGIKHRIFNIILNALRSKVISEEEMVNMVAFICASMRKIKKEKEDGKEEE